MKKIRLLTVQFDTNIKGYELPAFRGAIVDKVGKENIVFHNHLSGNTYVYRYPLIQYKIIKNSPAIQCIDYGVDEIHKFFENSSWDLKISDRILEMKIKSIQLNQFTMQVWDKKFDYSIQNWIALNQDNYKKYKEIESLSDRISFLEKTLTANIISFAKGIEWTIDKPIELKIKDLKETKLVSLKGEKIMGFNVDFNCNVFIPNYIGLGKSVSLGYGMVKQKIANRLQH